jgi:flagellar motor switch protein FliG
MALPSTDAGSRSGFTGPERAAVLMMLVGEDEAAAILQKLDPEEVQQLGKAMFSVADVGEAQVSVVLDDFVVKARAQTAIGFNRRPRIERVMTNALGADKAESVLSRIAPPEVTSDIDLLNWLQPKEIAKLIERENPQIAAVLIANLDSGLAAEVLQLLPEAVQPDLVHRVAKLGPVTPAALDLLKSILSERLAPGQTQSTVTLGGAKEAAKIMNNTRKATEQRVITRLQKVDRETARAIEEEMFVFDHLMALDDKSMGTLLRAVEADLLILALKGVEEYGRDKMLRCMSARAADSIRDEMEAKGPVRMSEVLEAQRAILVIARNLAKEGTIMMGSGDDDYV